MSDPALVHERSGFLRIFRRSEIPLDAVLELVEAEARLLKVSSKSHTRRVGSYVIKTTQGQYGLGPLKLTFVPGRYRRAWNAALHLERHGVAVPTPYAFIIRRRFGVTLTNTLVSRFIEDACDVEAFADRTLLGANQTEAATGYLFRLADAVNRLCSSGAYHADLSGKNILTRDGETFWFIDLDSVRIGKSYSRRWRLRNHIQLYDSFCDRWSPTLLRTFIDRLGPPEAEDPDRWFAQVQRGQLRRRARHEARGL